MTKFLVLTLSFMASFLIDVGNAQKPNVIVILADDLGYGDVQPLNSNSTVATPNFNRLASDGITFTDAHSPSSVCTPTRYGLICGRYPWRSKMKRGVLGGYSKPLIEPDRQTIATVMKKAGYQTACIGKWHLGLGWQWRGEPPSDINNMGIAGGKPGSVDFGKTVSSGPSTLGFDYSFVIPASLDMSPYVFVRNGRTTSIPVRVIDGKSFPSFYRKGEIAPNFAIDGVLDELTIEACQFVEKSANNEQPFFLYFPLTAPHKPVLPHSRFKNSTKLGPYGDFIAQVDWTVGQILKTLDRLDLADNTMLVVTSDNGSFMRRLENERQDHSKNHASQGFHPANHTANGKFRGTKADIWEAGHRVPFFVRWPNRITAKSVCKTPICHTDIFATVAEIAGQPIDSSSAEDSHSFLNLLSGNDMLRPPIIHQSGSGHLAIRSGKWKLVMGSGSGGREKPKGTAFEKPFYLFDLSEDNREKKNLIATFPDIAKSLHEEFLTMAHGDHIESTDSK